MLNSLLSKLNPNALGASFMMLSMAGFVLNDTFMKLVADQLPLFQAIFIRGLFATALMAILCWWMKAFVSRDGLKASLLNRMVIWRCVGEAGGTFFFLSALFSMPIANVTAVLQVLPLTITLSAALFLGETVGWRRYLAIAAGFIGVLLIVKPGTDGFNWFAIYALIATLFITLRDIVTRKIPKTTPSLLVSLLTAIVITIMGAIGSAFVPWVDVNGTQIGILASAACILMVGYICSILAMRSGDISFVAPFRYSILIWALLLGYFVFDDIPDFWAIIGAIIIVFSGLFSFYRERMLERNSALS